MPCSRFSTVLVQACLLFSIFAPGLAELLEIPHHGHHRSLAHHSHQGRSHHEHSHHEHRHQPHHRAVGSSSSSVDDAEAQAVATKVSADDEKWHDVDASDGTANAIKSAGTANAIKSAGDLDVPDDGEWHDVVDSDKEAEVTTKVSLGEPSPLVQSFIIKRDPSSTETTTQPPAMDIKKGTSTTMGIIGGFHVPKEAWVQEQAAADDHSSGHHHNHAHHQHHGHHAARHGPTTSSAPEPVAAVSTDKSNPAANDDSTLGGDSDAAVDEHTIRNPDAKHIQMDLAKLKHDKQVSHRHKHHKQHEKKKQAPVVRSEVLFDGTTL